MYIAKKPKMPSDRGNPSIHVIFRGVLPKNFVFDMAHIIKRIDCFHEHLTLKSCKLETWVKKNRADSKYDSQSAPSAKLKFTLTSMLSPTY